MTKRTTTTSGMDWNSMLGLTLRLKQDKLFRDYLLITTGCYFGLRINDLLSLRWNQLLNKDEIVITEQKTKKLRRIAINPKVSEAIILCSDELVSETDTSQNNYVFANRWGGRLTVSYINKRLKVIFREYNVSVKNPSSHTLRKTFGKRIYESDNKSERALVYLSEIFGHSSISITRRYIGITQEQVADIYLSL